MKSMQLFDEIVNDNTSGSMELVRLLQAAVMQYLNSEETKFAELDTALRQVAAKRKEFPVVLHFIYHFLKELEKAGASTELFYIIEDYNRRWNTDTLIRDFYRDNAIPGKNILVHSNSSTVTKTLEDFSGNKSECHIFQTFSSPAGEGMKQADTLADMGFPVTLLHENNAWNFSDELDMFLFGADRVEKERFMNKTGTALLCLMAREKKKPVFVLADPRKNIDDKVYRFLDVEPVEHPPEVDPDELAKAGKYPDIAIKNQYFEWIPCSLVTRFYS